MKKKQRRVYKDADGNKLPSVTEILGGLGWKYAPLMAWANKIGREGKTLAEGSRDAMDIGTVAHDLIDSFITGRGSMKTERPEGVSLDVWGAALDVHRKFLAWWEDENMHRRFVPLASELAMVDHERRFGGTADLIGLLDGEPIVLDYKTGKSIYAETALQLFAYADLWAVSGYLSDEDGDGEASDSLRFLRNRHRHVDRLGIIHIPVEGRVSFVEVPQDVVSTARQLWPCVLEMSKHKRAFDNFSKKLHEIVKREEPGDDKKRVPF